MLESVSLESGYGLVPAPRQIGKGGASSSYNAHSATWRMPTATARLDADENEQAAD